MIVVLSLLTVIFFALPRSESLMPSSLMPRSLKMAVAPVSVAMIAEHRLAAIAVTRGLYGTNLQNAAELVHDERGQGFAFDVFGDDQQRLAGLRNGLENGHQVLRTRNLLLVHEDQAVFELDRLLVWIGDEVGREEAAIELHAFDDFDRRVAAAAFVDGDDAVFADLREGVGEHVADRGIVVARDRGDLLQALFVFDVDLFGLLVDRIVDGLNGFVDAAAEGHGIGAGCDHFEAFAEDAFGEHRGGRGAVASDVVRLAGGFFDELRTEVFERVIEFDVLRDGDAVFGHFGGAPAFVEHGIAAAGAERAANGTG